MNQIKKYKSFSFKPFNLIRILVFGFLIVFVFLSFLFQNGNQAFLYSLLTISIVAFLYVSTSYTEVVFDGTDVSIWSLFKKLKIKNVKNYQTWWSYDFGISSPEIGDTGIGKSNQIANKINLFLKFYSEDESVCIYEQIFLGQKYPENHPYKPKQYINKSKTVRVWDIDKCLNSLQMAREKHVDTNKIKLVKTTKNDIEYILNLESLESNEKFIIKNSKNEHLELINNLNVRHLLIRNQSNENLGFIILSGILDTNKSIEFRRIVIEEKGKRTGRIAVRKIKEYCFEKLQAKRLWLDVLEENQRARGLYESEGFKIEGRLRDAVIKRNKKKSLIVMAMLESEYIKFKTKAST